MRNGAAAAGEAQPLSVFSGWSGSGMRGASVVVLVVLLAGTPGHGSGESESRGTPARGSLKNGVSLPASGDGFESFSWLANALGRQYVHSRVRDTLVAAFGSLHAARPDRVFVVGETGWKNGGRFRPHRSHQNGLSVDVFMPVVDEHRRSVLIPTPVAKKFGYELEFDAAGKGEGLSIDFSSVAELLVVLDGAAKEHGLAVDRVIVAPEYVDLVLSAGGARIAPLAMRFMRKPAWVRHDEHVHVDFRVVDVAKSRARRPTRR